MGAFRALRVNLAESHATISRGETIAWRYALLRGHEVFETALPFLSDDEWETFRKHLLPVFADCYAAVPHLSLERLAALRDAEAIDIVESGDDAQFLSGSHMEVRVRIGDVEHQFHAMIDARGQTSALPQELPFPSLVEALYDPSKPLEALFRLALKPGIQARVFCPSMPQILVRYPFSQGLPNCAALAETVAKHVLGVGRERLRQTGVGMVRERRKPDEEHIMATTTPKKPETHGAAAGSHRKDDGAKDQPKSANSKPSGTGSMPSKAGNKSDSGKKSR